MLARVHIKDRKHTKFKKEHIFNKRIQNSAGCQSTPLFRATNSYKFMHSGKRLLIIWAFDRKIIARVHIKTRKHKILKRNIFSIREYKTVLDVEVHRFAE